MSAAFRWQAALKLFVVLLLWHASWWEIQLTGDRCLYPETLNLFVRDICVGKLDSSEHRAPLCLPLMTDEMYLLPPTDDRTLFRFGILDTAVQLQALPPLILLTLGPAISKGGDSGNALAACLHMAAALLAVVSVVAVLSAPTANAAQWAEGTQTCEVTLVPGSALAFAAWLVPLELALVWYHLRDSRPAGMPWTNPHATRHLGQATAL
mmetsp:Transcript_30919/g.69461  ORF Transcript_30919/g.69461 Transcript_30919/m.69461 type:complete len:209 (-) Transcript_30919:467-1093(-)